MSRILSDPALQNRDAITHNVYRSVSPRNIEHDKAVYAWVCDMAHRKLAISGARIQAEAQRLAFLANEKLPDEQKIKLKFSDGWLGRFKLRWKLPTLRRQGESEGVPDSTASRELSVLQNQIAKYNSKDVFNCDESGLFWQATPDRMSENNSARGIEKQKPRFTFLCCCNADGSERLPLFFIGSTSPQRFFNKKNQKERYLNYKSNRNAWMTSALFFEWLLEFDEYIRQSPDRRVLLILDTCSAHGSVNSLPQLRNVSVTFLPPNTSSRLQPLDAGIKASMKLRYRLRQVEYAADLADSEAGDIFKVDILSAMTWLVSVWKEISAETISWSWRATGLMGNIVPCESVNEARETEVTGELERLIRKVLPEHRRIPAEELLCPEEDDGVTQDFTETDIVDTVVHAMVGAEKDKPSDNEDVSPEVPPASTYLGSLREQLGAVARVKLIIEGQQEDDDELLKGLRLLQWKLRSQVERK